MKKFKIFSLVILAVMLACTLSGCTAANSATVFSIQSKFKIDVKEYLVETNRANSAIIYLSGNNYKFNFNPVDNGSLQNKLSSENKELYVNLCNNQRYHAILDHASEYFFTKFMTTSIDVYQSDFDKIEQEKLTKLYNEVENVLAEIKEFGNRYRDLSADYVSGNTNSQGTRISFNNLLQQYKNLIGSVLKMNLATLDIYDNSLLTYADLSADDAEIPMLEINRILDAYELYATEYLYQRYMVYGDELDMTDLMNSALYAKLNEVTAKRRTSDLSGANAKTIYIYLRTIENSMNQTIELNRHSAQVLNEGLPEVSASDYNYKKAIYDDFAEYETTMIGYLNQIESLIDGTVVEATPTEETTPTEE